MELLGDLGQVEARFSPFRDSINLWTSLVHRLGQTCHRLRKSFWIHQMELLGDLGQMEARFGLFGDNVNLDTR
jgi:hypothetical protein